MFVRTALAVRGEVRGCERVGGGGLAWRGTGSLIDCCETGIS